MLKFLTETRPFGLFPSSQEGWGQRVTSGQVLRSSGNLWIFSNFIVHMLRYCPVLNGPFQLSSSMVQIAVYGEVEMTSQDSRQLPGEALPIAEDLSKSPEVVKSGVPVPLSSFPAGPPGPVDCLQTHFHPAPSSVLTGSSTRDGVDQTPPPSRKALRRISLMFWPPDVDLFFFGFAAFLCRRTDEPSQAKPFLHFYTSLCLHKHSFLPWYFISHVFLSNIFNHYRDLPSSVSGFQLFDRKWGPLVFFLSHKKREGEGGGSLPVRF